MGCCASGTKTVKVEPWPSFQDSFGNQESADHQQKSFKSPVIAKEVDKHHKGTDTSEDGIVTGRYDVNARDPKDRGRGIETTPLKPSDTATLVKECEQKSIKTVQTIVVRETKSTSSVDVNINAQPDRTPAPSPEDKHNQESKATNHVETKKSNVSDLEVEDLEVEDVEVKHRLPSDIIVVTVEKVRSSSTCDGAVDKLTDTKDVSGYGNRPDEARKHAAESKPSENAEIDQHMDLIIADIMSSTIDATLPEVPDLQLSALKTEEQKHTIHDIETKQCDDGSKRVSEDATSVGGIPVSSASRQAGEALSENPVNSTVNSNSEILTEYHESETVAKSSTDKAGEFSAGGPSIQRSSLQSKSQLDTTSEKSTAHIVTTLEAQQVSNIALEQIKSAAECKNSTVPSNSEILTEDNKRATVAKSSTDEAGEFSAGGPSIQTGSLQSKCLLGTASAKSTADMVASFEAQQVSNIAVEQIKSAAECGNSHDAKQYSCDNEIDKINEVDDVIGRKIAASGNSVAEKNTENLRDPTENVSLSSHEADATVTHLTQNLSSSAMGKTQGNDTALDTTMAIGKTGQTEETTDKDCESMTIEQSYECSAPGHPQESTAADTEKRHDNNLNVTGYEPDEVIQDSGQAMETNETIRIPESVEVMTEQHDTSRIGEMMSDSNQADHDRDKIRIETLTNENRGADFVTANEEYLKTDVTIRSDGIIKCNDEGPVLQGERAVTPVVPATTPSEISATGQALDTQLSMNSKLFTNEDSGCPPDRDELPRGIENSTSPSEVICTQDTHEVADSRNSDRNEAAETFPTLHSPTEENGEHSIKKTNSLEVGENLESKILTASSNPETENVASAQDTLAASSATSVKGLENMPADDTLADAVPCSQSDNMICENSEDITITEHNINYKILQSIPAGEEQKPKSSNCDSHVDNNAPVETAATDQANCAGTSGSNLSNDPCSASSLVGQNSFEDHQSGVVDHAEEANDKAEDASTSAATPCACSSSSPPLQHSDKNIPLILHLSDTIHEETTTNGEDNDASATVSKVFMAPDACSTQSLPMETLKQRSAPVDNQVIHENSTINENPKDVSITVSKVSSVTSDACSASSLPIPENEYPLPLKSQSTLTGIGQLDKIAEEHHGGSSVAVIIQCSQSVTPIQTEPKHSPLSGVSTQQNNVPHSVTSSGSCEKQEHSNAGINAREDATIPQKPDCDLTDEDKKVKSHDLTSPKSPEVDDRAFTLDADQSLMNGQNLTDCAIDCVHRKSDQEVIISEQTVSPMTNDGGQGDDNANKMPSADSLPEKSMSKASLIAKPSQTTLADDGKQCNDVVLQVGEPCSDVPTSQKHIVKSTVASIHEISTKEEVQRDNEAKHVLGEQSPTDCHTSREKLPEGERISVPEPVKCVTEQGSTDQYPSVHNAVDCSGGGNAEDTLDESNIAAASLPTHSTQVFVSTDFSEVTSSDFPKHEIPEEDRTNNGATPTSIIQDVTSHSEEEDSYVKDLSAQYDLENENTEKIITQKSSTETQSVIRSVLVNVSPGPTNKRSDESTHAEHFDQSKDATLEAACENGDAENEGVNGAQPVDVCEDIVVGQISDVDKNCTSVHHTEEELVTPVLAANSNTSPCSQKAGTETQELLACHQALPVKETHAVERDESTTMQKDLFSSLPVGKSSFLDDDMKSTSYTKEDTKLVGNITNSRSNAIICSEDRVETTTPKKDIRQIKSGEITDDEVIPLETDTPIYEPDASVSVQQPLSSPSACDNPVMNDLVTDTPDKGDSIHSCIDPSAKVSVHGRIQSQEKIDEGNMTAEEMRAKEVLSDVQIPRDAEDSEDSVSVTRADIEEIAGKGGAVAEQVADDSATRAPTE